MAHKSSRLSWTMARMLLVAVCVLALASPGWGADKAAPNFSLKDVLQGKEYSLSQFKGKVVVINFFTFFCGPCRDEMPDLNKINNELKGRGLQTLGIALSSDPTQIRFLVKQLGLEYPVLIGNDKVSDSLWQHRGGAHHRNHRQAGQRRPEDRGHPEKRNLHEIDRTVAVTGARADIP